MQYYIDYTKKPRKIRLFLLDSQGRNRGELEDAFNKKQVIKFNDINQLSFTIPYFVDVHHTFTKNPLIKKITKKNRIRAVLYNEKNEEVYKEEYVLTKKTKSVSDSGALLNVECYGRGYELKRFKIQGYEVTSYTATEVTTDCLNGTGWSIGYINPEFDEMYRSFQVSTKSRLEFLIEIAQTFGAIIVYDTNNKLVNLYKEEEISMYKGFWVSQEQYILNIEESTDEDEIITRLFPTGADDLTINGVNPTGQSYIDDFSYFYDVMSDSLMNSLINYNGKLEEYKTSFSSLLGSLTTKQEELTIQKNILTNLQSDLRLILDSLELAKESGDSTVSLTTDRNNKQSQIATQQEFVNALEEEISLLTTTGTKITTSLSYEENLNDAQLNELQEYIHVGEWSDTNISDEQTLMDEARKYLTKYNSPSINVSMGIVNFFKIVEEQHNWDRFSIGDIIRIEHDTIGTFVDAKVQEFTIDYENDSIDVTVSNTKRVANSMQEWIEDVFRDSKKTMNDYYYYKPEIESVVSNFNSRNDRISTKPTSPAFLSVDVSHTVNDDGSVNLTVKWDYPNYNDTKNNTHNIDGFEVFLYSSSLSDDYIFGSTIASEEKVIVPYSERTLAFNSRAANKYHTFGIRAYRQVDPDISISRYLYSDIVNSPSSPYRPMAEVTMNGRVNGVKTTVGAEPVSPSNNDIWVSNIDGKTRIWDGIQWFVNNDLDTAKSYTDQEIATVNTTIQNSIEYAAVDGTLSNGATGSILVKKIKLVNPNVSIVHVYLSLVGITTAGIKGTIPVLCAPNTGQMETGVILTSDDPNEAVRHVSISDDGSINVLGTTVNNNTYKGTIVYIRTE